MPGWLCDAHGRESHLAARRQERLPLTQHTRQVKGLQCDVHALLQVLKLLLLLRVRLLVTSARRRCQVRDAVVWAGFCQQPNGCSSCRAGVPAGTVQQAVHLRNSSTAATAETHPSCCAGSLW